MFTANVAKIAVNAPIAVEISVQKAGVVMSAPYDAASRDSRSRFSECRSEERSAEASS